MAHLPPGPHGAELAARIQSELRSGERLVWIAQPHPPAVRRAALKHALPGIVVMVIGVLFTLQWWKWSDSFNRRWNESAGTRSGVFERRDRDLFDYAPLLFVLIGFCVTVGIPLGTVRRARRTCYALTDQRAIICQGGWFGGWEITSYTAAALGRMTRRDARDGSGDLIFEEFTTSSTDSDGSTTYQTNQRGFLNVGKVAEVEALVRTTLLDRDE